MSKPSSTALLIAKVLYLLSKKPKYAGIVDPEAAEISRKLYLQNRKYNKLICYSPPAFLFFMIENFGVKGLSTHYAARKKVIEEELVSFILKGYEQVVILGAGFDSLAARLHKKYPQVMFIEQDLPDIQSRKKLVVDSAENLIYTTEINFDPSKKTIFIAEGLFVYLSEKEVENIISKTLSAKDPVVIFTSVDYLTAKSTRDKVADKVLKKHGEKYKWSKTSAEIAEFLAHCGYKIAKIFRYEEIQKNYKKQKFLDKMAKERGEHIYICTTYTN